jgi:DNA-directed RNA polymerase specialized sigma24 family protein
MVESRTPLAQDQVMVGILAMLIADREDRLAAIAAKGSNIVPKRTELVLADAGLSAQQIAGLLGKKPNSVAKAISRAKNRVDSDNGATDD